MIQYGDARKLLFELPQHGGQLSVFSPPYWAQRVYGNDPDEIGWGNLSHYLHDMGVVLDGLWHALDDDAVVFCVMGDKAQGSGGAGGDHLKKGSKNWIPEYGKPKYDLASGQWTMVPYKFAEMAQARGWLVRTMIVWDKTPNVRPEALAHANRPYVSTERIVMLAKHPKHRFFPKRLVEKADIWHIAPRRGPKAERHYAPYPAEIPRRAILMCSSRGDTVIDPFAGSRTTNEVAEELGRVAVGIELYRPTP